MNKKVLVISSSPRRGGNSDMLSDEFVRGAVEGKNQAKKIFLKDKKIAPCSGCGYCSERGMKSCSQKDDMTEILNEMADADVIVLSTPVYFYTMCGQMKTMIDRCCARYTEFKNKEFYYIITAADSDQDNMRTTVEEFRGFLSCLPGAEERGIIYGLGAWKVGEIAKNPAMRQAFDMGSKA